MSLSLPSKYAYHRIYTPYRSLPSLLFYQGARNVMIKLRHSCLYSTTTWLKHDHLDPRISKAIIQRIFSGRLYSRKTASASYENDDDNLDYIPLDAERLANTSFHHLGILNGVSNQLKKIQLIKPTPIQCLAIPPILNRYDAIIESHSGTGKTFAFLLPSIQDSKQPFSTVIIVPTRELAMQIVYNANRIETLCNINEKYHTRAIVSSSNDHKLNHNTLRSMKSRIIVGTGKKLKEIIEDPDNESLFRNVHRVIIDEVDRVLLPLKKHGHHKKRMMRFRHRKAADIACELLQIKSSSPRKFQLICASATVVPELIDDLQRLGWDENTKYLSYGLASTDSTTVKHQFLEFECNDDNLEHSKLMTVVRLLNQKKSPKPALLIVHRSNSVIACVQQLIEYNINAVALYEKTMDNNQADYGQLVDDLNRGKIDILVTNEESVRGLDFMCLKNVILLDVSKTTNEYLHIAGRVGRMGTYGTAITLVNKRFSNDHKRLLLHYSRLAVAYSKINL
ncbi:ATP-dependent RNA helicase CHR1 [Trichoplax sp. H2]|nr:ATP-dependent RNA helicase CHR1 [Trichoplax sp. H2]|eukprot:RDD45864.1 ATP-dependent RNA helicase CHR1 [Trichoplax sp. H2]